MTTAADKELFQQTGLYDPANEHDACGVGFVAHIKGQKSHAIVTQALKILENLDHRGAVGADPLMGDGAGILIQLPDALYREEMAKQGVALPPLGEYGVGMIFLPKENASRLACQEEIERAVRAEAQRTSVIYADQRNVLEYPEMGLTLQDLSGNFMPGVLEARYGIQIPATPGQDTFASMRAAHEGHVKAAVMLGGRPIISEGSSAAILVDMVAWVKSPIWYWWTTSLALVEPSWARLGHRHSCRCSSVKMTSRSRLSLPTSTSI